MHALCTISRARVGVAATTALTALALSAPAAQAQQPAPAPGANTISVIGKAQVKPTPLDGKSDASIRKAVGDARRIAIPQALANGRQRAAELSTLAGLPLGALISVAETSTATPFFFPGQFGEDGTFGPGRYCGIVRQSIFRRDSTGKRKRVGSRERRVCRVPSVVSSNLTMVFAAG